jgi:hypothetical protein
VSVFEPSPSGNREEQQELPDPTALGSPERVCPNCGRTLVDSRCKLVCPDRECGYFLSCSDFY